MTRDIGNIIKKGEGQTLEFKNPSIPNGRGPIDPDNYIPCPKNPTICKFMIQLGRFDELGSGVMNVNRYLPFYTKGAKPEFIEGDMFSVVVPADGEESFEAEKEQPLLSQPESQPGLGPESLIDSRILKTLNNPKSRSKIARDMGHETISGAINRAISRLRDKNLIEYAIPDKPQSRMQKYRLTAKGKAWLENR